MEDPIRLTFPVLVLLVAALACGGQSESLQTEVTPPETVATDQTEPTVGGINDDPDAVSPTVAPDEAQSTTAYSVGQVVFLVPELIEASPGPYGLGRAIAKIPHSIELFESVSNCEDLARPEPETEWVFQDQQGQITDVLACEDETFYRVQVDEFLYADDWNDWLNENQISMDSVSPIGYPFVLKLRSDQEFPDPYSPYLTHLPTELVLPEGSEGETDIDAQPARIALLQLFEIADTDSNIYRFVSTVFSVVNEGTHDIVFDSTALLGGKYNAVNVEANPSEELVQETPVTVVIPPNERVDFEVIWRMSERPTSERTFALYFALHTEIHEYFYIFVNDGSLFFRELLQPQGS